MSRAGVAVDDWKLAVFRRGLEEAGFEYRDGGEFTPGVTVLLVEFDDLEQLSRVLKACNDECARARR